MKAIALLAAPVFAFIALACGNGPDASAPPTVGAAVAVAPPTGIDGGAAAPALTVVIPHVDAGEPPSKLNPLPVPTGTGDAEEAPGPDDGDDDGAEGEPIPEEDPIECLLECLDIEDETMRHACYDECSGT